MIFIFIKNLLNFTNFKMKTKILNNKLCKILTRTENIILNKAKSLISYRTIRKMVKAYIFCKKSREYNLKIYYY